MITTNATTRPALLAARLERTTLLSGRGLDSGGLGGPGMGGATGALSSWVQAHCTAVDPALYGGQATTSGRARGGGGPDGFLNGLSGTLSDCATS